MKSYEKNDQLVCRLKFAILQTSDSWFWRERSDFSDWKIDRKHQKNMLAADQNGH